MIQANSFYRIGTLPQHLTNLTVITTNPNLKHEAIIERPDNVIGLSAKEKKKAANQMDCTYTHQSPCELEDALEHQL
jgi:hypothetical protein